MGAKANRHGTPARHRILCSAAWLLAFSAAACGGRATDRDPSPIDGTAGKASSGGTASHLGGSTAVGTGGTVGANTAGSGGAPNGGSTGSAAGGSPNGGTTGPSDNGTAGSPDGATGGSPDGGTGGSSGDTGLVGVAQLAAGERHNCALGFDGSVKCWGHRGEIGYGNNNTIGDNELPSSVGSVSVTPVPGVTVKQIVAGAQHSCALLSDDSVRCWGSNNEGEIGIGEARNQTGGQTHQFIGDDELPSSIAPAGITNTPGVKVKQLAGGDYHTCALLSDDRVQCWGLGGDGQLGYGNNRDIGRDELPSSVGSISVGTPPGVKVSQIAAGGYHTCVLFSNGAVKCWGNNTVGQLGYGNTDGYAPASSMGLVSVTTLPGIKVEQLATGWYHTCALLSDSSVKCWGDSTCGELGYGNTDAIGDDELPASVGPVSVTNTPGVKVIQIAARGAHTCALLSDGSAKCWGANSLQNPCTYATGELGYGNTDTIGDDELPSSVGPISNSTDPGVTVRQLALGFRHTCALLSDGAVECWGYGQFGQLGYGNTKTIGDDELPSSVGAISLF